MESKEEGGEEEEDGGRRQWGGGRVVTSDGEGGWRRTCLTCGTAKLIDDGAKWPFV